MNPQLDAIRDNLTRTVQLAVYQAHRLLAQHPGAYPVFTRGGRWVVELEARVTGYEGYLPGMLWLLYRLTRNDFFRMSAEQYTRALEGLKLDELAPNLGQIFLPSWKRWYNFSQEAVVNAVVVDAGRTLAQRFVPQGGYLHSDAGASTLHIESMLDLPLVLHAAQHSGDAALWTAARSHADVVRRHLVRGDGSTAEEALFEVDSGQFLRELHRQGWRSDSCWSRGLAAAIYGFCAAYAYTQNERDLITAENCARFYLDRAPEHGVPPPDFDDPQPDGRCDATAAALAAGGLWALAQAVSDPTRAWMYRQSTLRILETLTGAEFLGDAGGGWEGVLRHGLPSQESFVMGDYYLMETVWEVFKTDR